MKKKTTECYFNGTFGGCPSSYSNSNLETHIPVPLKIVGYVICMEIERQQRKMKQTKTKQMNIYESYRRNEEESKRTEANKNRKATMLNHPFQWQQHRPHTHTHWMIQSGKISFKWLDLMNLFSLSPYHTYFDFSVFIICILLYEWWTCRVAHLIENHELIQLSPQRNNCSKFEPKIQCQTAQLHWKCDNSHRHSDSTFQKQKNGVKILIM